MTIDIEKLIADIDEDGSGEIEYDEFRNLLSSSDWRATNNYILAENVQPTIFISFLKTKLSENNLSWEIPLAVFQYYKPI